MDTIDRQILDLLQENGKATASEISRAVSLSIPAVSERIRKLREAQIIEQYTVILNKKNLGYNLLAMIFVSIDIPEHIEVFRRTIVGFPEVIECYHIAGDYDYLLKVVMKDTAELESFLTGKLKTITGVLKTNTLVILSTLKETINR